MKKRAKQTKTKKLQGPGSMTTPMPRRFPDDHPHVLALINESERLNALAERWAKAKPGNPVAYQFALSQGFSFAVAAAWLRCFLKGEFKAST